MTSFTNEDRPQETMAPAQRAASPMVPGVAPSAIPMSDLALVIGNNAHKYLNNSQGQTWHWPAALVPIPWLLYRKMYWECFAILGIALGLRLAFPHLITPALMPLMVLGLSANALYLWSARRRVRKADKRDLPGARRSRYLARAGGVSMPGAILGSLITVTVIAPRILDNICAMTMLPC